MIAAFALTITLTMPIQYADGRALPAEPLPVLIWLDGVSSPIAATVAPPGATISLEVPEVGGCYYATAWALYGDVAQQSAPSNYDCYSPACGTSCHGGT